MIFYEKFCQKSFLMAHLAIKLFKNWSKCQKTHSPFFFFLKNCYKSKSRTKIYLKNYCWDLYLTQRINYWKKRIKFFTLFFSIRIEKKLTNFCSLLFHWLAFFRSSTITANWATLQFVSKVLPGVNFIYISASISIYILKRNFNLLNYRLHIVKKVKINNLPYHRTERNFLVNLQTKHPQSKKAFAEDLLNETSFVI